MSLDGRDRELVRATQEGLPICVQPFAELARRLGWSEAEVLDRFQRLLACRAIRRIAAVPNHYRLGYRANGMCVFDVADEQVTELGRRVGALAFVSHCYRRPRLPPEWPYNLFAMVHGRSRDEVETRLAEILLILEPACRRWDILWSTRILKKTGLRLPERSEPCSA
jgi:DNA-binding Lrp family transcriptional regulator